MSSVLGTRVVGFCDTSIVVLYNTCRLFLQHVSSFLGQVSSFLEHVSSFLEHVSSFLYPPSSGRTTRVDANVDRRRRSVVGRPSCDTVLYLNTVRVFISYSTPVHDHISRHRRPRDDEVARSRPHSSVHDHRRTSSFIVFYHRLSQMNRSSSTHARARSGVRFEAPPRWALVTSTTLHTRSRERR